MRADQRYPRGALLVRPLDAALLLVDGGDVRESVLLIYAYLVGQLALTDYAQIDFMSSGRVHFEGQVAWLLLRLAQPDPLNPGDLS